jgi:hypothetical protein
MKEQTIYLLSVRRISTMGFLEREKEKHLFAGTSLSPLCRHGTTQELSADSLMNNKAKGLENTRINNDLKQVGRFFNENIKDEKVRVVMESVISVV